MQPSEECNAMNEWDAYYEEATKRNIGLVSREEQ